MRNILRYPRTQMIFIAILAIVVIFVVSQLQVRAVTYTITVDGSNDDTLFNLGNTAPDNTTCDLREAIAAANSYMTVGQCILPGGITSADDFLIVFDAAVTTIALQTELPQITATVEIQGAGLVTLEAAAGQTVSYGLYFTGIDATLNADNSMVTGLIIQGFTTGVIVDDVADVVIGQSGTGNEIINNQNGIVVTGDASQTVIEGNVIAENSTYGIYNENSDQTSITDNNFSNGTGNGITINILNSNFVTIDNNNDIADSDTNGIVLSNADNAAVTGNTITANGSNGVLVINASSNVQISSNTITNNGGDGVGVGSAGSQALIEDNIFSNNGGLGIDLGVNGVNANDAGDGDSGPNGLQNYPVITLAATDTATTYVQGTFPTQAGVYDFIYYVSNSCDPSGFGEGETILQTTTGNASGPFTATIAGTTPGQYLTIIAINQTLGSEGNTSEFSQCFQILDDTVVVDFTPMNVTGIPGQTINFTNLSTGVILGYTWTVTDSLNNILDTATTVDYSFTFPLVDVYTVELCVTTLSGIQCLPTTITIVAPTATPTPSNTPIPPTPIPTFTPSITPTGTPSSTGTVTSTSTSTMTSTATLTSTSTSTMTSTATLTSTSTSTMTSTATLTSTSTSTMTSTMTSTATASSTVTSTSTTAPTQTATLTSTATQTGTPDMEVTVEDLDANSVGINVFNASDFDVSDVELVIDPRSAVYSSSRGSFACVESGGIFNCTIPEIAASAFATQVIDCTESSNVNCSALGINLFAGGASVTVVDEPYIIKVGEPPVANAGAEIVYTVRLINPLDEPVFDVTVTDRMPTVMRILDSEAAEGTVTITGQDILFELEELDANGSVAFTVTTQVRDDFVFNQIVNSACLSSSENPTPRCASMSFLRTAGLPATGEINLITNLLRWITVPLISGLMLFGIWLLFRKIRHTQ